MDLPALEREVLRLLSELPTSGSNADQLALFQRVQELVLHRDPTGDAHALLHAAAPFLATLAQHQNAALVAALLQFLAQATRRSPLLLRELYEATNTLLMLSFSTEKNVMSAIQMALANLPQAFQLCLSENSSDSESLEAKRALWAAATASLEHMVEIVATAPLLPIGSADSNNNRSALVWLRAWKYLESAALLFTTAKDAAMYRDPARSNVQPDELTIDRIAAPEHLVLDKLSLEALGAKIVKCLCERIGQTVESGGAMLQPLGRREVCVAINSVALIAALRPHLMPLILPSLVSFHSENLPGSADGVVQATLKANLVKLLSHPAAQEFADEVTECLISFGASERAFRAISKSKEPRRKYVSAPSEASLRKARIGKRSAQSIAEKVENDTYKRHRIGESGNGGSSYATSTGAGGTARGGSGDLSAAASPSEPITHEGIVNMASPAVVNLVLESFTSELPGPTPPNLKLELTPSELKARMLALLGKLATPSSALAIENSNKRMRDPRRRRDPRVAKQEQPSLVQIFDGDAVDEVSDWISKNASSIAEPLISVSEDNVVQVFLKPATAIWCREMAVAALSRILENEHGVSIRGDEKLRESVLCRLASSPWLLLTDDKNNQIDATRSDAKVPVVYQSILDFVLEDVSVRATLATALIYHEYSRFAADQLAVATSPAPDSETATTDAIYRKTVAYFFSSLATKMDLSSTADKKLFGTLIAQLPRVTTEVLQVLGTLFAHKSGVVLGITTLRDLIKDRAMCQTPALRILLRYTCHEDESTRNSSIRCVANQLYSLDALKEPIEQFAIRLVKSLGATQAGSSSDGGDDGTADGAQEHGNTERDVTMEDASEAETKVFDNDARRKWMQSQIRSMRASGEALESELLAFAKLRQEEILLSKPLDNNEQETLRRVELYLALCAKKPTLLTHIVATYAHASDSVRQVIFHAIEKLIKHLKQRGSVNVVAQLHGFEPNALGFVCHVVQILSVRARPNEESAATEELVQQVIALYHAHEAVVPDAISVLIPILPSIRADVLFPLLPQLLSLPQARLSVAITRLLEAMPPQVVAPIDLLVALHHVDLKSEPMMQKKVISAINFCVEHRHAFPSDVLLHVCRVLVQDDKISKLALRTLILSVTAYPALQQDMTALLEILVSRRVWEMEDALWKGFVKCSALIQPASFPLLLQRLPPAQLRGVLEDEPELRKLMHAFVMSADLHLSPEVRELIAVGGDGASADDAVAAVKTEDVEQDDIAVKTEVDGDEAEAFVKTELHQEDEDDASVA